MLNPTGYNTYEILDIHIQHEEALLDSLLFELHLPGLGKRKASGLAKKVNRLEDTMTWSPLVAS